MSSDQTRRTLNQLDKDLADLEKKMAAEVKKEAEKTRSINSTQKSITKNTSVATKQSKLKQIQGYQNDLERIAGNKADISKKIADKKSKSAVASTKLRKEEAEEAKKAEIKQKAVHSDYEKRISDLTSQLTQQALKPVNTAQLYSDHSHEEYDVFISHATEDKESFADELFEELQKAGVKVWYDTIRLDWGDSLRSTIDNGLKKSKYGIVIITTNYINKGWTRYELDGLFQIEMTNGKTILPIWHNISKKEVQDFSPSLAGRVALNTAMLTPAEIAIELLNFLVIEPTQEAQEYGEVENAQHQ
ncbi:MAG: toll/interleukin-1 receptor domain-containing protein [Firmicutes bacterium]|nr:toll/interleukin-1 receptor domain-containing protein [Bacillota bacterium]